MKLNSWIGIICLFFASSLFSSCKEKTPPTKKDPDLVFGNGEGSGSGSETKKPAITKVRGPEVYPLPMPKVGGIYREDRIMRDFLLVQHRRQLSDLNNTLAKLRKVYVIGLKNRIPQKPWVHYVIDRYQHKVNTVPIFTSRSLLDLYKKQLPNPQNWMVIDFDVKTSVDTMMSLGQYFKVFENARHYVHTAWMNPYAGPKNWERKIPLNHMKLRRLFHMPVALKGDLNDRKITDAIKAQFKKFKIGLPENSVVIVRKADREWEITAKTKRNDFFLLIKREKIANVQELIKKGKDGTKENIAQSVLRVYQDRPKFFVESLRKNFNKLYFIYKKRSTGDMPKPLMGFDKSEPYQIVLSIPVFTREELARYYWSRLGKNIPKFKVAPMSIGAFLDEVHRMKGLWKILGAEREKKKYYVRGVWLNPSIPKLEYKLPVTLLERIREVLARAGKK